MAGSIPSSELDAVNNAVKAAWLREFSSAQDNLPWKEMATDVTPGGSKHKVQQLDWMGESPDMQDVTNDALRSSGLRRFNYSIRHRVFKAALRIPIVDLDTDALGQIQPRIQGLTRRASGHPGRLMFDQLEANPLAYDGTALFSATRAFGAAANVANTFSGSGTTAAQIAADLATMRARMLRFEDDNGEPMELSLNTLEIPPELSPQFRQVLVPYPQSSNNESAIGVAPAGFVNKWTGGGYTVYELARLSDTNNWYGSHVGEELNPFVYSWVKQPAIMNTPSMNDASALDHDYLVYVVRGNYEVGVSLPQYHCRCTN